MFFPTVLVSQCVLFKPVSRMVVLVMAKRLVQERVASGVVRQVSSQLFTVM